MGYRTVAISSGGAKEQHAKQLGAHEYIDSSKGDAAEQLLKLGGARVILSTMNNAEVMTNLIKGLTAEGVFVVLGVSQDPVKVAPSGIVGPRKRVQGWPSGTSRDSEDALKFASLFNVKAEITEVKLQDAQKALDNLASGKTKGRSVIVFK